MAKSTRQSSFERDSKAVLESVLTSDAKARVHREMSRNRRPAAGDAPAVPGDAGTTAPDAPEKSLAPKISKAASKKGKLTLAELNRRLERFVEESRGMEQQRRTGADDLSRRLDEMHAGLNDMDRSMRALLARSEEHRKELSTLGAAAAELRRELDSARLALAERPWKDAQAAMEATLGKLDDRVRRLESGPPLPAVAQPMLPAAAPASAKATEAVGKGDGEPRRQASAAGEWLDKARAYWSGRRYSDARQAMACLDKALALAPDDAHCLNERGLARADAGLLREALADFSRALEAAPHMAAAYHNRGLLYVKLNLAEKACADFQRAADLGDDRAWRKARESGYCGGSALRKLLRGIID